MSTNLAGQSKISIYRMAIKSLTRAIIAALVFSAAVNLLMLTGPIFMLQVYDRVLSSGSVATLQGLFLIVVLCFVFLAIYDFLRTRIMSRASFKLDNAIAPKAFETWVKAGISGEGVQSRPLNDLSTIRGFVSSPVVLAIFDLPWVPFYIAMVYWVHPLLGGLAIGGAIVVAILALLNQLLTRKHVASAIAKDSSESFFVEQAHRSGEAIAPLGMIAPVRDHWLSIHSDGMRTSQIGQERSELITIMSKSFRLLLQSALLGLGGYLALQQEISAGMIVAASIIAGRALAPLDQVISQWRNVLRARDAHKRLAAVFEALPEDQPLLSLPEPSGNLEVADLVKYPPSSSRRSDDKAILDGVSFALRPGEALGVIGPSTSGKTTLARCLIGSWAPDLGEIRLSGAKLDQWPHSELGKHIGYLPQITELLHGTVSQNISRFAPNVDDEIVLEAAKLAGVHELVLKLSNGYNTIVTPGRSTLSGGQMQRIGLARALYGNPKLIVLDEPNSNLDKDGDEALTNAIVSMREKGSALVVMAHRPSAIAAVNKILVLNDGRVVDYGDKDTVISRASKSQIHAEKA